MPGSPSPTRAAGSRSVVRLGVTVALVALVWWPARPGASDGFPLSNYPMFGYARPAISRVHTVLGVRSDGRRVPLTPWHVGGTDQPKQALSTAQHAVLEGRSAALCTEVAARVAASPLDPPVIALEVVTDAWDLLGASHPDAVPQERRVHARCEVP